MKTKNKKRTVFKRMKALKFVCTIVYNQSVHRNRHLKFRNLKIKNLQFSQFFQNQFEKNYEFFFNFQIFEI